MNPIWPLVFDLKSSLTLRVVAVALFGFVIAAAFALFGTYRDVDRVQKEKTGLDGLSPREFEIFRMILDAKSTDEIASAFNLSRKTVANYHYAIKSKLGVDSDIDLFYFGLRQGLVEPISPAVNSRK